MKFNVLKLNAAIYLCVFLGSCGNETSVDTTTESPVSEVETKFELGRCSYENDGVSVRVKQEKVYYICTNNNWLKIENVSLESPSSTSNIGLSSDSFINEGLDQSSSSNTFVNEESVQISSSSIVSFSEQNIESSSSKRSNYTIGSFTDSRDMQTYKTVTIGSQTWMAENLNYNYNIGSARSVCCTYSGESYYSTIKSNSTDCGADQNNCQLGRLYTYSAAVDSAALFGTDGEGCGCTSAYDGCWCSTRAKKIRGICPSGWHLPNDEEWELLIGNANAILRKSGLAIDCLKSKHGWNDAGNGSDYFEFSVYPTGEFNFNWHEGSIDEVGSRALFWSGTVGSKYSIRIQFRSFDNVSYIGYENSSGKGYSIRCIKD